jgi:hypothetical protein
MIELVEQLEQDQNLIRGQAEIEVFNLVGELLAVSFEKYDVEVIIESEDFLTAQSHSNDVSVEMKTEIESEKTVKTNNNIEIILSGYVKDKLNYSESFMMYFSLSFEPETDGPWKVGLGKVSGSNSLSFKFGRKAEQVSDQVFRVKWDCVNREGKTENLGLGSGILVFSKDMGIKAN